MTVLQRIVVVSRGLDIGDHETPAEFAASFDELAAEQQHGDLLIGIDRRIGKLHRHSGIQCLGRGRLGGDARVDGAVRQGENMLRISHIDLFDVLQSQAALLERFVECRSL